MIDELIKKEVIRRCRRHFIGRLFNDLRLDLNSSYIEVYYDIFNKYLK